MRIAKYLVSFFVLLSVIGVRAVSAAPESEQQVEEQPGTISGKILIKGDGPLAWGEIMLYSAAAGLPPRPEKYDRTPDFTRVIDSEGFFRITVPPGTYYLGAVKRMTGDRVGTPQVGDYSLLQVDDKGKLKEYVVKAGASLDVGSITEARKLEPKDFVRRGRTTGITGQITDAEGNPVQNAFVLAYINPEMRGKPLFISARSDKNGRYLLRLAPGNYFLRARSEVTSGPPEPGDIVGYYGEGTPEAVVVKDGVVQDGVNFIVILFGGRGPQPGRLAPQ